VTLTLVVNGNVAAAPLTWVMVTTGAVVSVCAVTTTFGVFGVALGSLLIGIWALLQVVFAYIGPALGAVAWWAHLSGFAFGIVYAMFVRAAIARRLRRQRGF